MLIFIFYWMSLTVLLIGITYLKKAEEEELFRGITFSIIIGMSLQALVMGILKLIHLPANCYSVSVSNFIFGFLSLFYSKKNENRQKYVFLWKDCIANILFLCIAAIWGFKRFGRGLDRFHYETVDIGKHVLEALRVDHEQCVRGMYYAEGQVGLLYQSLKIFPDILAYQVAIIFEVLLLYLILSTFWSAIRSRISSWGSWILAIVCSCIYFGGYPACGEIFGSQYLVCGIMLVTAIVSVYYNYYKDVWNKKIVILTLMLLANGLAVCYAQFCPVVFTAMGIGVITKEKKIKNILAVGFSIFLIPCINAVIYILFGALRGTGVSAGLASEGYIYRDLYSDFLLILPFALGKLFIDLKSKKFSVETIGFVLTLAWIGLFLVGVLSGKIQGYYYYKNYYLLWIFAWIAGCGMILLKWQEMKYFIAGFFIVWGSMAFIHFKGIDAYLVTNYFVINQSTKSGVLFEIYNWNKEHYGNDGIVSLECQELYKEAGKLAKSTGTDIPVLCARGGFAFSYYAITEQVNCDEYIFESVGMNSFWKNVQGCEYLTVCYGGEYEEYGKYVDSWERVYENEAGYIAKVEDIDIYVMLNGMYEKEGTGEDTIRWGKREGKITYYNITDADIERKISFEIIGYGNIKDDSNVLIGTNGTNETYYFENGIMHCNLQLIIPAGSEVNITWAANVEQVNVVDGRELYIAFRNYDAKWDSP